MEIGSKIYYDTNTGEVIVIVWERSGTPGTVVETTREQDFASYTKLAERVPETVGELQLEYGAYSADFAEGGRITKIDLVTLKPLFTYPDPTDPETPHEPQPPLTEQVAQLKTELAEAQSATLEMHESQAQQDAKIQEANNATLELYELIAQGGTV